MMDLFSNQADQYSRAAKFLNYIIMLSVLGFALAYWNKDTLPKPNKILPSLYQDPIQTETTRPIFSFIYKGKNILVKPLANYELWAVVTSVSNSHFFLTDQAADNINVRDVCTIWNANLTPEVLSHLTSYNGEFTCFMEIASPEKYYKFFHVAAAVNNHFLTNQEKFRKIINGLRTGDQIYIKGLLVSYHEPGWGDFWRTSSLIHGTKHCKVIYLEDVKILARANPSWNKLYQFSKWLLIISLLLRFIVFILRPVTA